MLHAVGVYVKLVVVVIVVVFVVVVVLVVVTIFKAIIKCMEGHSCMPNVEICSKLLVPFGNILLLFNPCGKL